MVGNCQEIKLWDGQSWICGTATHLIFAAGKCRAYKAVRLRLQPLS